MHSNRLWPHLNRSGFHQALTVTMAVLIRCAASAASSPAPSGPDNQPPPTILALHAQVPRGLTDSKNFGGLLVRELVRQAVLVAARDGLGAVTRDENLGELIPDSAPVGSPSESSSTTLDLDVSTLTNNDGAIKVEILGGPSMARQSIWTGEISVRARMGAFSYTQLMIKAEALSRGEFVGLLGQQGLKGNAAPSATDNAPIPDAIQHLLNEMNAVSQFGAAREVQGAIRESGESPARLGALVRAYANLGQMTEFQADSSWKTYAARSLIYAQRMVAKAPNSPVAYWHRAYALALAGLQNAALADLKAARGLCDWESTQAKLISSRAQPPEAPAWVPLLETYAHCDYAKLELAGQQMDQWHGLSRFLAYLIAEDGANAGNAGPMWTLDAGKKVLATDPDCMRVFDGMTAVSGVIYLHHLTQTAPEIFATSLPARLAELQDLPSAAQVKQFPRILGYPTQDKDVRLTVIHALRSGPDRGDPSWAALANMIQGTDFMHVQRRAWFLAYQYGDRKANIDLYLKSVWPLVKDHPLAPALLHHHDPR